VIRKVPLSGTLQHLNIKTQSVSTLAITAYTSTSAIVRGKVADDKGANVTESDFQVVPGGFAALQHIIMEGVWISQPAESGGVLPDQ
jgi:hypothetical protein